MRQNQKRTDNSFTALLRPGEGLLWQSPENVDILASVMPSRNLSNLGLLMLFLMIVWGFITRPNFIIVVIIGALMVVVALALIPDPARYAITSERLFYERGRDLQSEALDNISLINVLPNNTLSFGRVFPQWTGLGDAEHVKHIIEQARKEHLKGDQL